MKYFSLIYYVYLAFGGFLFSKTSHTQIVPIDLSYDPVLQLYGKLKSQETIKNNLGVNVLHKDSKKQFRDLDRKNKHVKKSFGESSIKHNGQLPRNVSSDHNSKKHPLDIALIHNEITNNLPFSEVSLLNEIDFKQTNLKNIHNFFTHLHEKIEKNLKQSLLSSGVDFKLIRNKNHTDKKQHSQQELSDLLMLAIEDEVNLSTSSVQKTIHKHSDAHSEVSKNVLNVIDRLKTKKRVSSGVLTNGTSAKLFANKQNLKKTKFSNLKPQNSTDQLLSENIYLSNKTPILTAPIRLEGVQVKLGHGWGANVENIDFEWETHFYREPLNHTALQIRNTLNQLNSRNFPTWLQWRGTFIHPHFVRTRVSAYIDIEDEVLSVPMFNIQDLDVYLSENSIIGNGGFLFIEIPPQLQSLSWDRQPEKVILFDQNFQKVDSLASSQYALAAFQEPGFITIYLKEKENEWGVVEHITSGEILFLPLLIQQITPIELSFWERVSTNHSVNPLNIQKTTFYNLLGQTYTQKPKSNVLISSPSSQILGQSVYMEFQHAGRQFSVETTTKNNIILPDQHSIEFVLNEFGYRQYEGTCLMEIPFYKKSQNIEWSQFKINFREDGQLGGYDLLFQGQDGKFYKDFPREIEKIFILTFGQGEVLGSLEGKWIQNAQTKKAKAQVYQEEHVYFHLRALCPLNHYHIFHDYFLSI